MTDDKDTQPTLGLEAAVSPTPEMRQPNVLAREGKAFADSRDVAAFFEKRHQHVLRDIRTLIERRPDLIGSNFGPFKIKDLTGETTSHFEMDRAGFTLLAMGFTGEKALDWKLRYIEAFDKMEVALRKAAPPVDFSDPTIMLGFVQHLQGQVAEKDKIIAGQAEDLKRLDRIEGAAGTMCISTAAKTLKVRPKDLFARMSAERWIFKRAGSHAWLAYQDKLQAAYMEHRDYITIDGMGQERVYTRAHVTGKGLVKLAEILNRPMH